MSEQRNLLSIVVPVFNEEGNLPALVEALRAAVAETGMDAQFLFVDDGSTDGGPAWLAEAARRDERVAVIALSRNFGKEIALSAGLHHATGDACLMLDADLQHPPERIPAFVAAWRAGNDVVIGVRHDEADASWVRRACSAAFARFMSRASDTPFVPGATDFRLLDRTVVDAFNRFTEHRRMTRALVDWLGFRRACIPFSARARANGTSHYGFGRLLRLAVAGVVSHSFFPLKWAGIFGIAITVASGAFGLFLLVEKYLLGDPFGWNVSGAASLAVLNVFLTGVMLSCMGLLSLYVSHIHAEAANRPLYAVRARLNVPPRV